MNSEKIHTALKKLDPTALDKLISSNEWAHDEFALKFLTLIRHSSCMVVEWASTSKELRRDAMVEKCRHLLSQSANTDCLAAFNEHIEDAKAVERAYRVLENALNNHPVNSLTLQQQIWGLLIWVEEMMMQLHQEVQLSTSATPPQKTIDSSVDIGGTIARPDAIVNGAVENIGNTLLMLSHRHSLFDSQTGAMRIPPKLAMERNAIQLASELLPISSAWTQIRRGWDRTRFFGGKVNTSPSESDSGDSSIATSIKFPAPSIAELLDDIATQRIHRRLLVDQYDLKIHGSEETFTPPHHSHDMPLPPASWLSVSEFNTFQAIVNITALIFRMTSL